MKHLFITCAVLLSLCTTAKAQDKNMFNHLSVGVTAGTPGIGVDVAAPVGDYVQLRAGVSFMPKFNIKKTFSINENLLPTEVADYFEELQDVYNIPEEVEVKGYPSLTTGKILADVYPFKSSSFHVTGGFYFGGSAVASIENQTDLTCIYNANRDINVYNRRVEAGNIPGGTVQKLIGVEFDDYLLTADESGKVKCDIKAWAVRPYLGIGFGRAVPKNTVGFMFELGCQFWGSPKVYNNNEQLSAGDLDNEDGSNVLKTISKISVYPVMNFRICCRVL
jgi:hypothetical protein